MIVVLGMGKEYEAWKAAAVSCMLSLLRTRA